MVHQSLAVLLLFTNPLYFVIYIIKNRLSLLWLMLLLAIGGLQLVNFKSEPDVNNKTILISVDQDLKHHDYQTTFIGKYQHRRFLVSTKKDETITYHTKLQVKVESQNGITNQFNNDSSFNTQQYYAGRKIFSQLKVDVVKKFNTPSVSSCLKMLRYYLINQIRSSQPIVNALLFGQKDFSSDTLMTLKVSGLMHMFTISGMHVVLLFSIITFLLNWLKVDQRIQQFIILLSSYCYLYLANCSIPVFRALAMGATKTIVKVKPLTLLTIIMWIVIILNPFSVINPGFILSFFISYIILLLPNCSPKQLAIYLFLIPLPLTINLLYQFNLLIPLINLIALPLISIFFLPLSLLTLCFHEPFNTILTSSFNLFVYCLNIINRLSIVVGKFNFWQIVILSGVIIYYLYTKRYLFSVGLILFTSFLQPTILKNQIHFIDVNQGDATLISTKFNQQHILIDTGNVDSRNEVVNFLLAHQVDKLDMLIITHFDQDHDGNLETIKNTFHPRTIISSDKPTDTSIDFLTSVKKIPFSNFVLYLIPPKQLYDDKNNNSLITLLIHSQFSLMLPGDIEKEREDEVLLTFPRLKLTLLKAAHHGSKTSSTLPFLDYFKPEFIIISAGKNNRYHHPHQEVINRYQQLGINYWLTAAQGGLSFSF